MSYAAAPARHEWDWADLRRRSRAEALRVLGDPYTADEAAQEAIVRAWRHRDSCRQPERPFGWLRAIAHNEAMRAAAGRSKEVPVEEPLVVPNGQTNDSDLVDDRLLFSGILGTLSAADQELARLRYFEDLTCASLAEHFSTKEATVKVRLYRLRSKLKKTMEDQT